MIELLMLSSSSIGLLLQARIMKDSESPTGNIDSEFNLIPNLLPEFGGYEPLGEIPSTKLHADARGNCELLGKLNSESVPMSSSIVGFVFSFRSLWVSN